MTRVTGDEKGLQKLRKVTWGDKGLQEVTRGYKGLQQVTGGLHGVTGGYKG